MNGQYCEFEQHTAAAACGGTHNLAILDHARNCPVCSEVLSVAAMLAEHRRLSPHEEIGLPEARVVWRKARVRAREEALRRATLPIRTARIAAGAVATLVIPLLISKPQGLWPYASKLWRGDVASVYQPWVAASSASLLLPAIGAAIILIGMSAWFMLREE